METPRNVLFCVNPFMPAEQPKPPDNIGDIFLTKAIFRKYFKENCASKLYQQLSFKYFVKFMLHFKIISKGLTGPDDIGQINLKA